MPADPKRVQAMFLAAVEWPDAVSRAESLNRECGSDGALRERVEQLLAAHREDSFLGSRAAANTIPVPTDATATSDTVVLILMVDRISRTDSDPTYWRASVRSLLPNRERPMNAFWFPLTLLFLAGICHPVHAATDPADTHPELHLIPWPKTLQASPGYMNLTNESRIVAGDDSLKPLAEVLSEETAKLTGLTLKVATGPGQAGDIVLKLNPAIKASEPILMLRNREPVRTTDGAHTISIDKQVVVEGFDYRATAEGTSTILQLLGKTEGGFRLPRVTIKDWPHADFCGVMLDVARQDHPIESIKGSSGFAVGEK